MQLTSHRDMSPKRINALVRRRELQRGPDFSDLPDVFLSTMLGSLSLRDAVRTERVCKRLRLLGLSYSPRTQLDFGVRSFDCWRERRPEGPWLAKRWASFKEVCVLRYVPALCSCQPSLCSPPKHPSRSSGKQPGRPLPADFHTC